MAYRRNRLPSEFLHQVSTYLSLQDCYNCLYVCWFWYNTFQKIVYKKITIKSEAQLEQLLSSLEFSKKLYENYDFQNGLLIRELYLDDTVLKRQVHLSQKNLELLASFCTELEVFKFDITQWKHLTLPKTTSWKRIRQCAPVSFKNFDSTFLSTFNGLTHLNIKYEWEELRTLVTQIGVVSTLQDLTLEIINDSTEVLVSLSQCLQTLHASVPQLKHFTFIRKKTPHQESTSEASHDPAFLLPLSKPSRLKTLTLHGHVDSVKWFDFIAKSYLELEDLTLTQLSTSQFGTKWMWQGALVHMIQSLPSLKSLTLGGKNIPQLFSKGFALELKKSTCPIKDLYIDFHTYQAIESCQFLMVVASHGIRQLKQLKLRVWEQIPGWSGVTSNLFQCQQLVILELSLSKGLMDQFPYTPFLIDDFLDHLPQLQDLVLTGAQVQVTYNHFEDLNKEDRQFALRKITLCQSRLENHETISKYLSFCCPKLEHVVLEKCEMDKKARYQQHVSLNNCKLLFTYSRLEKIKLSSLLLYLSTMQTNDYIGINLVTNEGNSALVWLNIDRSKGALIYPTYELCEDQEKCIELTDLHTKYQSTKVTAEVMPCYYTPNIGVITLHCKSMPFDISLDDLRIPSKMFKKFY